MTEASPTRREILAKALAAAPLAPPAVGVALGVWIDSFASPAFGLYLGMFLAAAPLLYCFRRHLPVCTAALILAGIGVGGTLHQSAFRRIAANHLVFYSDDKPVDACITGTLLSDPSVYETDFGALATFVPRKQTTRFMLDVESIDGADGPIPVTGLVRINVHDKLNGPRTGDRVRAFGRLYRCVPPQNPGQRDWRLYQRRQGLLVGVSCEHAENITPIARDQAGTPSLLTRFRRCVHRMLLDNVVTADPASISILEAIIIGQRSAVDRAINDAFVRTGTVHILSVSGAHLAMLGGAIWFIASMLGRSRRQSAVAVLVAILLYALLAEPNAPVIRSAITMTLLCIALMSRRTVRTGNWLAASALIILTFRPCDLFDPGFQLSYVTLCGVIYFSEAIRDTWRKLLFRRQQVIAELTPPDPQPESLWRQIRSRVIAGFELALAASLAAWLAGVPLGLYHFNQSSTWGWLNSMLIAPLAGLLMFFGFTKVILAAVWPALGALTAPFVAMTATLLDGCVKLLAAVPGSSVLMSSPPAWLVAAILCVLGLWTIRRSMAIPGHCIGVGLVACFVAAFFWYWPGQINTGELKVRVLDVGAGTTTLIELPNGRSLLYDVGADPPYELYKSTLLPVFGVDRIRRLDAVLISHPHTDHFCGLLDLTTNMPVRELWMSPYFEPISTPAGADGYVLEQLRKRRVPVRLVTQGRHLKYTGDVQAEILWPPSYDPNWKADPNDTSIVLRLRYQGRTILCCGDIEREGQEHLARRTDIHADVLMMPHHGSYKRWTEDFVRAVAPKYLIRSSGKRDTDSPAGLQRLMSNYTHYNTADVGSICIRIRGSDLSVHPDRVSAKPRP